MIASYENTDLLVYYIRVRSMIDIYAAQLPTIPLLCKIVVLTNQNQSRQGGFVDRADQK